MELREAGGESKALSLIQQFIKRFRSIDYTLHPGDIPGEAAGKGSNMSWAARKLSLNYPMSVRRNVIVTGIDGTSCSPVMRHAHKLLPLPSLPVAIIIAIVIAECHGFIHLDAVC